MAEQEMLPVDREGPAPLPRPETLHCSGCRHLVTKWWKDYLDNDETDSGTSARCAAVPTEHGGESISAYWTSTKQTPGWCPFIDAARHRLAATKAASTSLMATARACADHAKARYAAEERLRVLTEHLAEQITHAETRVQDGVEMGAAVWRIALEDIISENRAALAEAGGRHG